MFYIIIYSYHSQWALTPKTKHAYSRKSKKNKQIKSDCFPMLFPLK